MSDQRAENKLPSAGVSESSATIAWRENEECDGRAGENQVAAGDAAEVAGSAEVALEQIDQLIGRINSNTAANTTPLDIQATLPASQSHAGHEDEALQNYMDQFLERVTGKKKAETESPAGHSAAQLAAPIRPPAPEKQREIKRAPESVQDLSLMRELANRSARGALTVHEGQRIVSGTRNSFLAALSLSLISSLLAVSFLLGQSWAWTSALLVMLLAGVLAWRFFRLRGQLHRLNDGQPAI